MISNEELVVLFRESGVKKNKDIIFNKIYANVHKEAMQICHYYAKSMPSYCKSDFFEEATQEASVCLLRCINNFDTENNTLFSTFYHQCLQRSILNFFKNKMGKLVNEVVDDAVVDWTCDSNYVNEQDDLIDKNTLKQILSKNVDTIKFSKPIHKEIFKSYIGFKEDCNDESFASLGRKFNLSRMAIKKICNKYYETLYNQLLENGDMDRIKLFL